LLRTALATPEPVCARGVLLSAECFGQSDADRSRVDVSNSGLYRRSLSKEAGTARLKTDANGGGMATAASGANCAARTPEAYSIFNHSEMCCTGSLHP